MITRRSLIAGAGALMFGRTSKATPYPRAPFTITWDTGHKVLLSNGDNYPATTDRNGNLYCAYGDGYGFNKNDPVKSLGFAEVAGRPWSTLTGTNKPSNIDLAGHGGSAGYKASGILAVGNTLYCLVRNYTVGGSYKHSRLASSNDGGTTWTWANWYFSGTFGCPNFVQGSPDSTFAYVVSQDNDTAYEMSPHVVLARVPRNLIADRSSWEFRTINGWSPNLANRAPVFTDLAGTFRVSLSFNPFTARYLLVSSHQVGTLVRNGSLGVFSATSPWGPWQTVYYSDNWSPLYSYEQSIPPLYMSGKTFRCLSSGQRNWPYSFTLRRGVFS